MSLTSRELVNFKISGSISIPDGFEPVYDCDGNVVALKKDGVEVRLVAGIEIEGGKDSYKAICCEAAMQEEGFILIDYDETVFEI